MSEKKNETKTPRRRVDKHGRPEILMADWALAPGPMPRMKTQPAESKKA